MDFRTACDRLKASITDADIAQATGMAVQSIRAARLDPASTNYRTPPAGWPAVLARLADERAERIRALATELREGTRDR